LSDETVMIISSGPEETRAIGEAMGRRLRGGTVLALHGELGAGKTCLVQGIARGLGVAPSAGVSSPTFVLINEYRGRLPLFHFDLYRLPNGDELIEMGWEDYLDREGVIAVEWAERMGPLMPGEHVSVHIAITGEDTRTITLSGKRVRELAGSSPRRRGSRRG
jgi:tRNA threonylcarbamoyladenosine biosynthesis protein TsaE